MEEVIEKINNILKYQINFKWQNIYNYKGYKNSFEYHVHHHPKSERGTGKWDPFIDYHNEQTIAESYYKTSVNLSKKFGIIFKDKYDIQYIENHESVNIVDMRRGLIVCLKYNKNRVCFDIATCFFPSKIYKYFSIRNKVFSANSENEEETIKSKIYFTPYMETKIQKENDFKETMKDFFGGNSREYRILFENEKEDIDDIINNIVNDVNDYLNLMESIIKNENDKKYFFVFNDGLEYIIKLCLLYKIRDNNYGEMYKRFLNIDIDNSYKNVLDECKKYVD